MGRGRAKGKKQIIVATRGDPENGEEVKIPVKRRGRPLKTLKNEIQEEGEEAEKVEEEEDGENTNGILSNKSVKPQVAAENGRKRRRPLQINENLEKAKEKNGVETKIDPSDSIKPLGFRQNGSRRKNKPQRAAEVGVECK